METRFPLYDALTKNAVSATYVHGHGANGIPSAQLPIGPVSPLLPCIWLLEATWNVKTARLSRKKKGVNRIPTPFFAASEFFCLQPFARGFCKFSRMVACKMNCSPSKSGPQG